MISEVKAKIKIVSYIVITINGYTDWNTILFISIRIILHSGGHWLGGGARARRQKMGPA